MACLGSTELNSWCSGVSLKDGCAEAGLTSFPAVTWGQDAEWPPAHGVQCCSAGRYPTTRSWKLSIRSSGEKVVTWQCQRPLPVTELGARTGHQRRTRWQLCSNFPLRDQRVWVSQLSPLPAQVRAPGWRDLQITQLLTHNWWLLGLLSGPSGELWESHEF